MADKPELKGEQSPSEWQIQTFYEQVFARRAEATELEAGLRFVTTQLTQPVQSNEETPVWQYGYGGYDVEKKQVDFKKFAHFSKGEWRAGPKVPDPNFGFLLLRADSGHTGRDSKHAPIRRWTAPHDALISIAGVIDRPSEHGDGVIGRIVSSRSGELSKYAVPPKGKQETRLDRIEVKRGEIIDFIVECGVDDNSDSFNWAPLIQSDNGEWDAKIAFSGPPPPRPAPLRAWEKYAQVLLSTNEFVFVD
ncbi:MAG: hypothetical protein EOP84_17630 [Verrucomicrobiaceae bacterium]|nr:MAG: hypothetical protein EOP84_17630 [Verrucomicrobiaceae bacterium]